MARAKSALKAEPKTETKSTGTATESAPTPTSTTRKTSSNVEASRKPSSSSSAAAKTSKTSVAPQSKPIKKVSEVVEEEEEKEVATPASVDKKVEVQPADEGNIRAKRSGLNRPGQPSTPTTTPATPSSLVAARKKQLHEQQAKSSPINAPVGGKKVSVKTVDKKSSSSVTTSQTERVVKASTERLDVDKRVPRQSVLKKTSAAIPTSSSATSTSTSATTGTTDRQVVKASTEKLDSVAKRASVIKSSEVSQSSNKPAAVKSESSNKPSTAKVENSARPFTKKSSSINVVLAAQRKDSQEGGKGAQKNVENVEKVVDLQTKKNPLLSSVLETHQGPEVSGSAENLSTRVNLSSASSITSEQVKKKFRDSKFFLAATSLKKFLSKNFRCNDSIVLPLILAPTVRTSFELMTPS